MFFWRTLRAAGKRRAIATRLAGERGADYAELVQATVRSVTRGILGVALIQSLLAGLGFLAVGIPGAGLLALVCLLLGVVQIGPAVVLIGTVIYVFSTADTVTAVIFLIWSIFVGLIDNVLKPVLLGRGVKVPMVVIFVGAIGGFLASGIIGLFVGAVVLALSFTLFKAQLPHFVRCRRWKGAEKLVFWRTVRRCGAKIGFLWPISAAH